MLAVGGVLTLGGVANFVYPKVELRVLSHVVSTPEARLAWIIVDATIASIGLWILCRRPH
jgi:uncharacterized protein YjeT (DUF2065 family)